MQLAATSIKIFGLNTNSEYCVKPKPKPNSVLLIISMESPLILAEVELDMDICTH